MFFLSIVIIQTLKEFTTVAGAEVKSLSTLYSGVVCAKNLECPYIFLSDLLLDLNFSLLIYCTQ